MDRMLITGVEFNIQRADEDSDDSRNIVEGYAMRWDDEADLGYIREKFMKGAFKGRMDSTVMLIGHDRGIPLASINGETLELREDEKGLLFRAQLNKDSQRANEVILAIERKDLTDVSVGFSMRPGGEHSWVEADKKNPTPLYKIHKVGALNEVSFVYKGAYPKAKIKRDAESKNSVIKDHYLEYRARQRRRKLLLRRTECARILTL